MVELKFGGIFGANRALIPAAVLAPPLAVFSPKGMAVALALTALLSLTALIRQSRLSEIARNRVAPVLALALAWALSSWFWSIDASNVLYSVVQLGLLFVATVVTMTLSTTGEHEAGAVRRWLLVGVPLAGVLLLWEMSTGGTLTGLIRSLLNQSNDWREFKLNGATALFLILFWPAFYLLRSRRRHLVAFCSLALLVTILTESTTAKIALTVAVAVYVGTLTFGRRVIEAVAVLAVCLVLAAPLAIKTVVDTKQLEASFPDLKRSALHRLIMWEFASDRIAEKPLTGWGLGASRSIPGGNRVIPNAEIRGLGHEKFLTMHPHNGAIQAWLELGLPGAALLAALVWLTIRGARHFENRPAQACAAAAATMALIFALSSWNLWQAWWISTLALSAALTTAACKNSEAAA